MNVATEVYDEENSKSGRPITPAQAVWSCWYKIHDLWCLGVLSNSVDVFCALQIHEGNKVHVINTSLMTSMH